VSVRVSAEWGTGCDSSCPVEGLLRSESEMSPEGLWVEGLVGSFWEVTGSSELCPNQWINPLADSCLGGRSHLGGVDHWAVPRKDKPCRVPAFLVSLCLLDTMKGALCSSTAPYHSALLLYAQAK
jgi:hypothetical protein